MEARVLGACTRPAVALRWGGVRAAVVVAARRAAVLALDAVVTARLSATRLAGVARGDSL